MTRLYFVRHGENTHHAQGLFASTGGDDTLTERGRQQARQIGQHFADRPIDAVISSPLPRARQTAALIAAVLGCDVEIVGGLEEVDVGHLSGERADERTWKEWNRVVDAWAEGRVTVQFAGGETYLALASRMRAAVEHVMEGYPDGTVIVVTHGGLLRATLNDLCPGSNVAWYRNFPIKNGAIIPVDFEVKERRFGGREIRGKVIEWASTDHLSEEAESTP